MAWMYRSSSMMTVMNLKRQPSITYFVLPLIHLSPSPHNENSNSDNFFRWLRSVTTREWSCSKIFTVWEQTSITYVYMFSWEFWTEASSNPYYRRWLNGSMLMCMYLLCFENDGKQWEEARMRILSQLFGKDDNRRHASFPQKHYILALYFPLRCRKLSEILVGSYFA